MSADPVYLDHNATTPVAREVAEAVWPHLTGDFGNPSSASVQGRRARAAVDHAREQVAALVGAEPDEIVFTSGGTEANNIAIRGAARHLATRVAVTSCVEHPAMAAPLAHLRDHHGWQVHELPVDGACRVVLDEMPSGAVGLGTLILAHNETGALQPVPVFAERVHRLGGLVHADAAQAVGKIPVDVDDLRVDLLSIAGHKLYGPTGIGVLYGKADLLADMPPYQGGGEMIREVSFDGTVFNDPPHKFEAGTPNIAGFIGLGAAGVGALALVADLGRPERFLHMMRTVKLTSPMSVGTWILSAYAGFAGITTGAEVLRLLPARGPVTALIRVTDAVGDANLAVSTWASAVKAMHPMPCASSSSSRSSSVVLPHACLAK